MASFHALTVESIHRETRDSVLLTLRPGENDESLFRYKAGQHLILRTQLNGEEVRRSYSICSSVGDSLLRVAVKKVSGGAFSSWANDELAAGATIDSMLPSGHFTTPFSESRIKHYAAFAVGSGITPVISLIKTVLETEAGSQITLVYGNRSSASIMFREELDDLKNLYLQRLNIIHVLSQEQQDIGLFNGRIDAAKCKALFAQCLNVKSIDEAFICGPKQMMLGVSDLLQEAGLAKDYIHFELFVNPDSDNTHHVHVETPVIGGNVCKATVIIDGRSRTFTLEKNSVSLLEAALAEGIEVPYACKDGVCSTCRAKLVQGEVKMDVNYALVDAEIAQGFILNCQSFPVTDKVVVDYDQ